MARVGARNAAIDSPEYPVIRRISGPDALQEERLMPDFQMPDIGALNLALKDAPLELPQSDKGRFFNYTWWPSHYREVEEPVLKVIAKETDPSFDRRVNIMRIAERVDSSNGNQLARMGFTPTEITTYVTRAVNKRLKAIAAGSEAYYVIRNQKLTRLALEHKPA